MYQRFILWLPMVLGIAAVSLVTGKESGSSNFETVHNSNAAILNRLGLVPLRIPDGHHKKRLAGPEPSGGFIPADSHMRIHQPYSRRHGNRDSHVYIVKLPASQPYYTLTKPHKPSSPQELDKIAKATTRLGSGASPQVGFHSNGKPGKIYHWNLPIVKKMAEKKRLHSQLRIELMRKKLEAEMTDQEHRRQHEGLESLDKTNSLAEAKKKQQPTIIPAAKPLGSDLNGKRYHHLASVNALNDDEKPSKHVRNNDKRLSYPGISEQLRKSSRPESVPKLSRNGNATSNKMYRLEDSNLYRLGVGGLHSNDRLAGWKLSNELHASRNTAHGTKAKKHRKKAAMSYYAPINSAKIAGSSTNIQNHFSGNGKPKAFYVMEKSRQPVYYHPLLP